ncbi:MAG: hypothetical protein MJK18_07475, partial [Bdellovibrionales bacterium]|nr:hypothetical protein [Bdellovibrionales bacterium]
SKFYQSTITEGGEIYIEVFSKLMFNVARPAAEEVYSAQISETNLNQLKSLTASLVNSEIAEVKYDVVCMLMPSDFMMSNHLYLNRGFDSETETFNGELELVLGPQGCWVSNKVNFKNKWDNTSAQRIKTLIEILTYEYAH